MKKVIRIGKGRKVQVMPRQACRTMATQALYDRVTHALAA